MKSYDRIMGAFNKTIEKLNKLNARNMEQVLDIEQEIKSMESRKGNLKFEAEKAKKTADKLAELIG